MAARKKADLPEDWISYRSRPTAPNPFGEVEEPYVGDLQQVIARARSDRESGMEPVVEYQSRGATWATYRPIVTVEKLRPLGLAHEETTSYFNASTGKNSTRISWKIDPRGYELIRQAATADPITFDLEQAARA